MNFFEKAMKVFGDVKYSTGKRVTCKKYIFCDIFDSQTD